MPIVGSVSISSGRVTLLWGWIPGWRRTVEVARNYVSQHVEHWQQSSLAKRQQQHNQLGLGGMARLGISGGGGRE